MTDSTPNGQTNDSTKTEENIVGILKNGTANINGLTNGNQVADKTNEVDENLQKEPNAALNGLFSK